MADALVPLYSTTLASATNTVTISGIPATGYRDIRLVADIFPTASTDNILARFNGDSSGSYSYVEAGGNGSSAYSGSSSTFTGNLIGYLTTAARTTIQFDVFDYGQTDKQKTSLVRQSAPSEAVAMRATRWPSTAAVNSITITCVFSTFAAGSTFSLYGILG